MVETAGGCFSYYRFICKRAGGGGGGAFYVEVVYLTLALEDQEAVVMEVQALQVVIQKMIALVVQQILEAVAEVVAVQVGFLVQRLFGGKGIVIIRYKFQ